MDTGLLRHGKPRLVEETSEIVARLDQRRGDVGRAIRPELIAPREPLTRDPQERKDKRHSDEHGGYSPDPPLEPGNRRRQDEREENGQRERNQYRLRPVQNGYHQHAAGECDPGFDGFGCVLHA